MDTYIAFDTETTGIEPGSRVIELGGMKMDMTGKVVDTFCQLINPGMPLPADAQCINRITQEELANAPSAGEVITDFLAWMGTAKFGLAHFAPYDMNVLSWEMDRAGIPHPALPVVDTCDMAKAIKGTPNNKLTTLVEFYGLRPMGDAHRALADADACRQYYERASRLIPPKMKPWCAEYSFTAHLPEHMRGLRESIESGQRIRFGYTDNAGAKTEREITPYGYALKNNELYFHGWDHGREARRTFKMDQVVALEVTP